MLPIPPSAAQMVFAALACPIPATPPPRRSSRAGPSRPFARWPGMLATAALVAALANPTDTAARSQDWLGGQAPVAGLIVRLRDAVPHEQLRAATAAPAREQAQAQRRAEIEGERWSRVIDEAGLGLRSGRTPPQLAPTGRDQQHLAFSHRLGRAEALALRGRLMQRPEVAWVELNTRERPQFVPDDPLYSASASQPGQWWLQPVGGSAGSALADRRRGVPGLQTAWLRTAGPQMRSTVVAVLDTGLAAHPELDGQRLPGYDFVSLDEVHGAAYANDGDGRDPDPSDPGDWVDDADQRDRPAAFGDCVREPSTWHGTIVAGLVAATTFNGQGVAGAHPTARILPVRVAGKCGAELRDIVDGMRWAAGLPVSGVPANPNPARIVNVSFGGTAACGAAYQEAVNELRAVGAVVVAAAGNQHASTPTRPASCTGVVGVVGLNRDGFKAHHSNFGTALSATGIATVSGDDNQDPTARWNALADGGLLSVFNDGTRGPAAPGYALHAGTSFAAPIASSVLSLMLAVNPSLTADQLIDGLRRSARPHVVSSQIAMCADNNPGRCLCSASTCGPGILDAEQALVYAGAPGSYLPPVRSAESVDHPDIAKTAAAGTDRVPNAASPGPVVSADPPSSTSGGGAVGHLGWPLALALAAAALRGRSRRSTALR